MKNIFLIIPCYNEQGNIRSLLEEIRVLHPFVKPVVINDCSTDNTIDEASKVFDTTVISLPVNLGVGGAVQTGFIYSTEHKAQIAVKIDGDGQHAPSDLKKLLTAIENNEADIIIGSRFLENNNGFKSSFARRLGIRLLQKLCKILIGQTITDPTSGYRAYNKKALEFMAENYPSFDYPEPEELVLASRNHLRIAEIPVTMRERQNGTSSIGFWGSAYYMIKVVISMLFISLR